MQACIQMLETARDQQEAKIIHDGQIIQEGLIGVRILKPSPGKPTWRVQAFFEDATDGICTLPDGMTRVMLPESLLAYLTKP